jgi:hypothetical protein
MTPDDPKPLSPDLLALLGAEKGAVFAPAEAKARVLSRLGSVTGPALPRTLSPPSLSTLLAFAVGVGVGGAAMHWGTGTPASPSSVEPPQVVHTDRPEVLAPPGPPWHTVAEPARPTASVAPAPEDRARPIAEAPTASVAPTDQLAAERSLLDAAREALARGNGSDALGAVAKHEERYPSGALAEEREAMAIQALLLVKRFDDGRARGARFHKRFPRSVLMPAVDAALASIP